MRKGGYQMQDADLGQKNIFKKTELYQLKVQNQKSNSVQGKKAKIHKTHKQNQREDQKELSLTHIHTNTVCDGTGEINQDNEPITLN